MLTYLSLQSWSTASSVSNVKNPKPIVYWKEKNMIMMGVLSGQII